MKKAKSEFKDNLARPFEKPESEMQQKLHEELRQVLQQDYVVNMSYPELFDVLDRVKLTFQLDMCKRMGLITYNLPKTKRSNNE